MPEVGRAWKDYGLHVKSSLSEMVKKSELDITELNMVQHNVVSTVVYRLNNNLSISILFKLFSIGIYNNFWLL